MLVFLITQDGDSPRTHKRQLENLPLLVRDLPLLVADTPFFPQNRDGPAVGNLVDAQTRDATAILRTFFERKGLTNEATNWLNVVIASHSHLNR